MFVRILENLTKSQKATLLMLADLTMMTAAFAIALYLSDLADPLRVLIWHIPALWIVGGTAAHVIGLNRIKLKSFGLNDIASLFAVATVTVVTFLVINALVPPLHLPLETLVQFGGLLVFLTMTSRFILLKLVHSVYERSQLRKRVLIYGAGQTGQQLAAALQTDDEFQAACFVDDDASLHKMSIMGLRVHAPERVLHLVNQYGIDRVVLAMPSAEPAVRLKILKRLSGLGCEVLALPSIADIVLRGEESTAPAPVRMNDLLGRDAVETDLPETKSTYRDHNILVTGAGGSIGGELCRQIALCRPSELVLVDHSEYALYQTVNTLRESNPGLRITAILGSIAHAELVRETLIKHKIDVVFHAAAYKHVNLVEVNAFEGVRNNVLATRTLAEESRRAGVGHFILVSTDKAVRPTSIMGSSKRLAELVVQDLATRSEFTKFSMVRFGNVLGSSGSVIPLFQQQIQSMGPVTVTHRDVTRYFMTVDEAVRLVLLTGSFSRGGDVFVLDMGKPVSIYHMARKMIESAGYSVRDEDNPGGEIPITFIGLKPGEKMHEELLIGSDMLTTPHPKILRAQENLISELEVASALQDLRRAVEQRDEALLMATLQRYVESEQPATAKTAEGIPLTVVAESK